jgi:hypothetical protein
MGFVTKNNNVTLNAYYTQKGRIFYINGQEVDKVVKYFSLGDSDTNYIISSDTGNILTSGFISDVTGDVDDCLKSVSDGVDLKSLLYKTKTTDTVEALPNVDVPVDSNFELRVNLNNTLSTSKNFITATIDLGGYIAYLNKFGAYSVSNSDGYNLNQQNITSFLRIFDTVQLHDNTSNISYSNVENFSYEISDSDFKLYEQLNRFLLISGASTTVLTQPYLNYQTSPLHFITTNQYLDLVINNRTLGYGNWSIVNGVYTLIDFNPYSVVNKTYVDNYKPSTPIDNFTANVDNTTQELRPTVKLEYFDNNNFYTEYYILREDYVTKNFNAYVDKNNQYIKSFVDMNNKKSLITRESELLSSFILNRNDIFDNINGVYYSKPLNVRLKFDNPFNLKVKDSVIKIILKYNPLTSYIPNITDKYVTLS